MTQQNKLKLIRYLNFICIFEASKPLEEMNEELIDACVTVLLDLQDKHVELSPEYVNEKVRKIFHTEEKEATEPETVKVPKKVVNKKKIWLVAACIAILVALFSIASIAFEWNIFDELKDRFGTVAETPKNVEQQINGVTVIMSGDTLTYNSSKEAFKSHNLTLLQPNYSANYEFSQIVILEYSGKNIVTYNFNNSIITCDITLSSSLNDDIKNIATETLNINDKLCYFCIFDDVSKIQVYFEYRNNLYQINGTNKNEIINFIENLKEYSYEN